MRLQVVLQRRRVSTSRAAKIHCVELVLALFSTRIWSRSFLRFYVSLTATHYTSKLSKPAWDRQHTSHVTSVAWYAKRCDSSGATQGSNGVEPLCAIRKLEACEQIVKVWSRGSFSRGSYAQAPYLRGVLLELKKDGPRNMKRVDVRSEVTAERRVSLEESCPAPITAWPRNHPRTSVRSSSTSVEMSGRRGLSAATKIRYVQHL